MLESFRRYYKAANLVEKHPRVWFQQLTDAFNASPTALKFGEDDNLDTGNASPELEPFRPFVDSVLNSLLSSKEDPHRRYTQLNAHYKSRTEVGNAVRAAFSALSIGTEDTVHACVAYGATHAWEACCRHLIQHRGDIVLVPTPTYTLLVPPVLLAGGQVKYVHIGAAGILTPEALTDACSTHNREAVTRWLQVLPHLLRLFASDAEAVLQLAHGTLSERIPQDSAELRLAFEPIVTVAEKVRDAFVATKLVELFQFGAEALELLRREHRGLFASLVPPRVVALLLVNPTLGGLYYSKGAVAALAPVLRRFAVHVVEDLAYTLMPLDVAHLETLGRFSLVEETKKLTITILGLSKPLSIANHRVSVVLAPEKAVVDAIDSLVKASVAQVASYLCDAVAESLAATDALSEYVKHNYLDASIGYRRKLRIALGCLQGGSEGRVATELLQALVSSGVSPSDPAAAEFIKGGLAKFLTVQCTPQGGIFVLVDASHAIARLNALGLTEVSSSYDLSIFLALSLRVRVIPEELMNSWDSCPAGSLLRLSFSAPSPTFSRALFELFKVLTQATPLTAVAALQPDSCPVGTDSAGALPIKEDVVGRDLTPAEQSMFVEQMQRAKAYTVVSPAKIRGVLKLTTFQKAVDLLVAQHPSLTFTYPFHGVTGRPYCRTGAPPAAVVVEECTTERMRAFAEQAFDVSSGAPLSAIRLFRVRDDEHILLLVQHHIVTDNHSISVLMSDLFHLYGLSEEEAAKVLPPPTRVDALGSLPWSKPSDVQWHAQRLLSLPTPFPLAEGGSIGAQDFTVAIIPEMHQRILEASPNATEFEIMMSVTALALQSVFPSADRFGVLLPATLRLDRDSQNICGFAVNSLVCRVDVGEDASYATVLENTCDALRSSREHVSAPLPHVAKYLREHKIERVGEIAIMVRPPPTAAISKEVHGTVVEWSQVALPDVVRVDGTVRGTSKHGIAVTYSRLSSDRHSGMLVEITVSNALPSNSGEQLQQALQSIAATLSGSLCAADVETGTERFFRSRLPRPVLVPHLLLRLVAEHLPGPTNRALSIPDQGLAVSFSELLYRILHTAGAVQQRGWKRVALVCPPGAAFVVGFLATTLLGSAVVPLDVSDHHKNAKMAAAGCDGLIVDSTAADETLLSSGNCLPLKRDGSLGDVAAPSSPRNLSSIANAVQPQDIAIIYVTAAGGSGANSWVPTCVRYGRLRRQIREWRSILDTALGGNSGRVVATCATVDTAQYAAETVVPLLFQYPVVVCPGSPPALHANVTATVLHLSPATLRNASGLMGSTPILWGPLTPEALSNKAKVLAERQKVVPVVTAVTPHGLLSSVAYLPTADLAAGQPVRFGRPCGGATLAVVRAADGKSLIRSESEVGVVAVSWTDIRGSFLDEAAFSRSTTIVDGSLPAWVTSWHASLGPRNAVQLVNPEAASPLRVSKIVLSAAPEEDDELLGDFNPHASGAAAATTTTSATAADGFTDDERTVVDLFVSILNVPRSNLGRSSDFFDMGGDSFTLSQLANRMQHAGVPLSVAEIINKLLRDMTVHGASLLLAGAPAASRVPPPPGAATEHVRPVAATSGRSSPPQPSLASHAVGSARATSGRGSPVTQSAPPLGRARSNSTSSLPAAVSGGDIDWEAEVF